MTTLYAGQHLELNLWATSTSSSEALGVKKLVIISPPPFAIVRCVAPMASFRRSAIDYGPSQLSRAGVLHSEPGCLVNRRRETVEQSLPHRKATQPTPSAISPPTCKPCAVD